MQKNRHHLLIVLVALGLIVAAGCEQQPAKVSPGETKAPKAKSAAVAKGGAATKPGATSQPQFPEAADKAVRSLYAKARYHKIETAQTEGVDVYTVHLARLATKIVVTADGDILMVGRQLDLKDLPKGVAETITKTYGDSTLKITQDDVRAEIKKTGETAGVVKVDPIRTFYEVQVLKANDPKNHKGYMRVDSKGAVLK